MEVDIRHRVFHPSPGLSCGSDGWMEVTEQIFLGPIYFFFKIIIFFSESDYTSVTSVTLPGQSLVTDR